MRPASLLARLFLFDERTDMSNGAQRAGVVNGRSTREHEVRSGRPERWRSSVCVEKNDVGVSRIM